jgi:hypothetical protein
MTVLDCTPQVRHDNFGDRAVARTGYRAFFCANAISNSGVIGSRAAFVAFPKLGEIVSQDELR